jgi:CheY-like chemotaxis protein
MGNSDNEKERALVVEDEPAVSQFSQRVLVGEGYTVQTAGDGQTAQDILEHEDYELIFLDVRMKGMTGIELYQWLKEKYAEKAEKVVFMTGDVMSGNTQTFLEHAHLPFLLKPFTPNELRNAIKELRRPAEDDSRKAGKETHR